MTTKHQSVSVSIDLTGISFTSLIYLIGKATNMNRSALLNLILKDRDGNENVINISLKNNGSIETMNVSYSSPSKGKYTKTFQKTDGFWKFIRLSN